jgi:thiamine pyrophosphokinase
MSSHHIVREAQEPALFLYTENYSFHEQLGDLLEWSPVVICTENSLGTALQNGIKVDVILCPKEFVSIAEALTQHQQPIKIIATKEDSLTATLTYLMTTQHHAVTVCTDKHLNKNDLLPFIEQITVVVLDTEGNKSFWAAPPYFSKWLPKNQLIQITPMPLVVDEKLRLVEQNCCIVAQAGTVMIALTEPCWITLNSSYDTSM